MPYQATICILLGIGALLLAVAWLLWKGQKLEEHLPESNWTGNGIDLGDISLRVQRVRCDFASQLQSRAHDAGRQKYLLVAARKTATQLAFFRSRSAQSSAEPPAEIDASSPDTKSP